MSDNIKIVDVLTTDTKGLSIQAYKNTDGWSRDHVYQRAVIDKHHEHFDELESYIAKAKQAKSTVELLFNAWLEGNQHLNASLGHDKAKWVHKIAYDDYDSVEWSDIIDVGHRKAIRAQFKSLAKSDCAKVFRLYKGKENELSEKINAVAIKHVSAHVDAECVKLKEQIHAMIKCALVESCVAGAEVEDIKQSMHSTGYSINYAILHDDFSLSFEEIDARDKRSKDKVASMSLVLSVSYEGDGRQNHSYGDKDCSIREVSICHIKVFDDGSGKKVKYLSEEDSIRIRSGSSDCRFSCQNKKQLKRIRLLLSALSHLMSIQHESVWARQDWMSQIYISK